MTISHDVQYVFISKNRPHLVVSTPKRTHPIWRYLWPFQSVSQIKGFVILCALGTAVGSVLIHLWIEVAHLEILIPSFLLMFLTIGPYQELPAKMVITTPNHADGFLPELHQLMVEIGYKRDPTSTNIDCFSYQMEWRPQVKWLYGMVRAVELCTIKEDAIEVCGPVRSLNTIRMFLRWKSGE